MGSKEFLTAHWSYYHYPIDRGRYYANKPAKKLQKFSHPVGSGSGSITVTGRRRCSAWAAGIIPIAVAIS